MPRNNFSTEEQEIAPHVFRKITHLNNLMMVLLRFENGPMPKADPYHNHPHEQITYVIKGKLNFMIEGISHPLQAGDTISIASGLEHTIQTLSETVELIDCFSPIREDFIPKM